MPNSLLHTAESAADPDRRIAEGDLVVGWWWEEVGAAAPEMVCAANAAGSQRTAARCASCNLLAAGVSREACMPRPLPVAVVGWNPCSCLCKATHIPRSPLLPPASCLPPAAQVVYEGYDNMKAVRVAPGGLYNNKYGAFPHKVGSVLFFCCSAPFQSCGRAACTAPREAPSRTRWGGPFVHTSFTCSLQNAPVVLPSAAR